MSKSPPWAVIAFVGGFLPAYAEVLVRMVAGRDIVDAMRLHAVRSLEWTLVLRSSMELTLTLMLLATGARVRLAQVDTREGRCVYKPFQPSSPEA